jgi:hypothetical protein
MNDQMTMAVNDMAKSEPESEYTPALIGILESQVYPRSLVLKDALMRYNNGTGY